MTATPDWTDGLEDRLAQAMEAHGVPGAALAVLRDGVLHHVWAGVADLDSRAPVTAETPFQIGSTTKALTASLVMQLVEAGRIALDAPVRRYLPQFRIDGPADAITVRQLLIHASGIAGDFVIDVGDGDDALARYVEALAEAPAIYEPGQFYSYCNAGYAVLGHICEVVTGEVWDELLRTQLFEPIGMTHSASRPDHRAALETAVGYDVVTATGHEVGQRTSRSWGPSGATLACTAPDVIKFAQVHLHGGAAAGGARVLAPETVAPMREPQIAVPGGGAFADHWGLGWMLMGWGGVAQFGHDGATAGSLSLMRAFPERGAAVVLQCNAGAVGGFMRNVAGAVFRELAGVDFPPPPPFSRETFDLTPYAGRYERYFAGVEIKAEGNELNCRPYAVSPRGESLDSGGGATFQMRASSRAVFIEADHKGHAPQNAVFLEFDPAGRPQFLFAGARAMKRVTGDA